ncbi:Low molecular weight protein-tyrosine-phosphatase Wzb [Caballeronia glathei]|jgi:protein-tyrosine phosphatase|uniref:protein-tyrosine-phosphatase n=1 Tax=Caballeronia glathei TaxID=60547 RepID=A0A069PW95_9BURK|nr:MULTISPECIES: low molecular weight protein-tyrosine-phosphatase [Burkholderiaceae]KDR41621.1 exopolysaccharide biosynthesis protein [Caballeronia glathei]TCK42769.1 protein tyrosine phosphatase [Paraburkholderia sp. BL8N3]CDY75872.1 Low molecular weight protein-tyrosine-phosphatase Wzb [Caballeronia glathei]
MFGSVLIVCHANVCRSPAAEMLFRAHLHERGATPIEFQSAGLYAMEGDDIDPTMYRLLAEQGVDPSGHRARRLDRRMARAADLILVPERKQITAIARLEPTTRGKVHLLGKWEDSEVADPYGGHETAYRESFGLIERLVLGWLNKIC